MSRERAIIIGCPSIAGLSLVKVAAAVENPNVSAIILSIDCPGGEIGTPDRVQVREFDCSKWPAPVPVWEIRKAEPFGWPVLVPRKAKKGPRRSRLQVVWGVYP